MAKRLTFDWVLPDAVFGDDLKVDDLRRRVREGIALSLFREGKVSSGLAAEMLGISRQEFLQLLYDKGLPYFEFSREELKEEFEAINELNEKLAK
jgi:predicted HTH domain antitoxin